MKLSKHAPGFLKAFLVAVFLASGAAAFADDVGPAFAPAPRAPAIAPPSPLAELGLDSALTTRTVLDPAAQAAPGELDELLAWNRAGRTPYRNGFARALPDPVRVNFDVRSPVAGKVLPFVGGLLATSAGGRLVWATRLSVEGAWAFRLQLSEVQLPEGTRFWVRGGPSAHGPLGLELMTAGREIWLPTVFGSEATLEVELPAGAPASFTVRRVMEVFSLAGQGPLAMAAPQPLGIQCFIDAMCRTNADLSVLDSYRKAVAALQFTKDSKSYICSGTLINDVFGDFTPYLITANHCFATSTSAQSLEAFFDFKTASCNGQIPPVSSLPVVLGSSLLATSTSSDFTFVRLSGNPSGSRVFMGWNADTAAVASGTAIFRVSHPEGAPQFFSKSLVDTSFPGCSTRPRPGYVYSKLVDGGTSGGSSGGSGILANGQIVGQLFGGCGTQVDDSCDYTNNREVDGAFSNTFAMVKAWLNPPSVTSAPVISSFAPDKSTISSGGSATLTWESTGGTTASIAGIGSVPTSGSVTVNPTQTTTYVLSVFGPAGSTTAQAKVTVGSGGGGGANSLTLSGGHVTVTVSYRNPYDGSGGPATPIPQNDNFGYFFFADQQNPEVFVKVLDFGTDRAYLLFFGGLTNFEYTVTYTNVRTGQAVAFKKNAYTYDGYADTTSLPH